MREADAVLVYDFGGGTTDVTGVLREPGSQPVVYKTVVNGGDPRLGGLEVDRMVADVLVELGLETKLSARAVKLALHNVELLTQHAGPAVAECRDQIVERVCGRLRPAVEAVAIDVLPDLAEATKARPCKLLVVLAGGASRLEGFSRLIQDVFSKAIDETKSGLTLLAVEQLSDPKRAVAKGAFLNQAWGQTEFVRTNVSAYRVLWPLDVDDAGLARIKYPYGRYRFEGGSEALFAEIIRRGATLPAEVTISPADLGIVRPVERPTVYFQRGTGAIEPASAWEFDTPVTPGEDFVVSLSEDKTINLSPRR